MSKYKLRSKVKIKDLSSKLCCNWGYKFRKFQKNTKIWVNKKLSTITYRESPVFVDPRDSDLGARIISPLEKLYLTIKKLNLKIVENKGFILKMLSKRNSYRRFE